MAPQPDTFVLSPLRDAVFEEAVGGGDFGAKRFSAGRSESFAHEDLVEEVMGGLADRGVRFGGAAKPRVVARFCEAVLTPTLCPLVAPTCARLRRDERGEEGEEMLGRRYPGRASALRPACPGQLSGHP